MITFLHFPEASQKTPGDGGLSGRSFWEDLLGKGMSNNLQGSIIDMIIDEREGGGGNPASGYFALVLLWTSSLSFSML